LIWNFLASPE
jgi:phospholipid-translocating ATPase